jgi:hypothetical protein
VPKHKVLCPSMKKHQCQYLWNCLWTCSDVTGSLDIGVFSCLGTPDLYQPWPILIAALHFASSRQVGAVHRAPIDFYGCTNVVNNEYQLFSIYCCPLRLLYFTLLRRRRPLWQRRRDC